MHDRQTYTTPRFDWISEAVSSWFLLADDLPRPRPWPKFSRSACHAAEDDDMLALTGALPSELRN